MRSVSAFLAILLFLAAPGPLRLPSIRPVAPLVEASPDRSAATFRVPQLVARPQRKDAVFQPCLLAIDCLALGSGSFRLCLATDERCPQDAKMYRLPYGIELPSNNALEQTREE